jgi:hypothetical protein
MSKAKMMCVTGCGAVLTVAAITGCSSSGGTTAKVTKSPTAVVTPTHTFKPTHTPTVVPPPLKPTHTPTVVPPPLTPTAPPPSSSTS